MKQRVLGTPSFGLTHRGRGRWGFDGELEVEKAVHLRFSRGWSMDLKTEGGAQARSEPMRHDSRRQRKRPALSFEALEPRLVCAAGISLALARDTGLRGNDRITSDATLVISRPLATGQQVQCLVNGSAYRTAVMTGARTFVPEGIGADGAYRVVARVVDADGRPSSVGPALAFRLDRSAAPLRVVLTQDTGVSNSDRISSNGSLVVSRKEQNALVQYSRDNGAWNPATAAWGAYAPQQGLNAWRVRQVDLAGNASAPVLIAFELDTQNDERVVRVGGPASGTFTAVAGQRIAWVLEFAKPMYVSVSRGNLPGIKFTFRGQELMARLSGGSGTPRLEYTYVFTALSAGTGPLEAPAVVCLCYGGLVTDAAGNNLRKHSLPALSSA